MPDAVVIGAGPNGLVAANRLADAGWDVEVLEAQDEPGGAVRSGEVVRPGYHHDRFSSFYPLVEGSAIMRGLELERFGLELVTPPLAVADPLPDGSVAAISTDLEETCALLEADTRGDGEAYRELYALWERIGAQLLDALFSPFPPVRGTRRLAAALGPRGLLEFGRLAMLPVRRLCDERFRGPAAARLLAGNALHADFSPEAAGSGVYALTLVGLAQQVGYPFSRGGSGNLTRALVRRLEAGGGVVRCGSRVEAVVVRGGRAVGVRVAGGREVPARRAVLADVSAPALYRELLPFDAVPARLHEALEHFQWDNGTVVAHWALDGPVPWTNPSMARAGTFHVTGGIDLLSKGAGEFARGLVPERPFLVGGQYAGHDGSRAPDGGEVVSAYTHVPQNVRGDAGDEGLTGSWDPDERERLADRMERELELVAPGFGNRVLGRVVTGPREMQAADENLVGGALNGGTAQIHQQLVFRPVPGLGRTETPVEALYLASASAHPGGGVHGACGWNAAGAALVERGRLQRVAARVAGAAAGRGLPRPAGLG